MHIEYIIHKKHNQNAFWNPVDLLPKYVSVMSRVFDTNYDGKVSEGEINEKMAQVKRSSSALQLLE